MELDELRKRINETDDVIMQAYIERIKLVEEVGRYKKAHNMEILNSAREKEVCERLVKKHGESFRQDIMALYPVIMNISKLRQARLNRKNNLNDIINCINKDIFYGEKGLKVAVQGVTGSYSMIAAKTMFDEPNIVFYKSFDDVFKAVSEGVISCGVLPIENSTAGSVNEVYDLLKQYGLFIMKARQVPIEHCLLGTEESVISDVKKVYSHPQALYQCRKYLNNHGIEVVNKINTAAAAEEVAGLNDKSVAAVASSLTAELYGLQILEKDIQDAAHNSTRFIAVTRENFCRSDANKISLVVTLENKEGSLFHLLNIIASYGVNITKLESRPIPENIFDFLFYFDITGNVKDKNIQNMLFDVNEYSQKMLFLGGYIEE